MSKRTYQPKKKKRSDFGFLSRMKSKGGKKVITARRQKKRKSLSASDEIRADKNKRLSRRR